MNPGNMPSLATQKAVVDRHTEEEAKEAKGLEEILRLPSYPAYRYETARVARRDLSGWWRQFVIRKGRNYGLTVGAPVIFSGGVVGRIREVHAYTAVVDLISSPALRIAASVQGDNRPIR